MHFSQTNSAHLRLTTLDRPGVCRPVMLLRRTSHTERATSSRTVRRRDLTVPLVRILTEDTLAQKRCGRRAVAFQWNYYEKLQNALPFRILDDVRVRWTVFWPAARACFQLAAGQSRGCAVGPRELSRWADVSRGRRRRQYAGGYQIGAAGHDIPGAFRRVERGGAASRGAEQPATVVRQRTCGGDQIFLFRPAGPDDPHHS